MTKIETKDVHLYYQDFHALKGISFQVDKGEIVAFAGLMERASTAGLRGAEGLFMGSFFAVTALCTLLRIAFASHWLSDWKSSQFLLPAALLLAACSDQDENLMVGTLERDRIELSAESNEPIARIMVSDGETVQAGQPVLEQDDARQRARLAQTQAQRDQATARLDIHYVRIELPH